MLIIFHLSYATPQAKSKEIQQWLNLQPELEASLFSAVYCRICVHLPTLPRCGDRYPDFTGALLQVFQASRKGGGKECHFNTRVNEINCIQEQAFWKTITNTHMLICLDNSEYSPAHSLTH